MKRTQLQRKTPMARTGKPPRQSTLSKRSKNWRESDKLDRAWRNKVIARWKEKCALADAMGYCIGYRRFELHCHHIHGRQAAPHLRHEPVNGILVCAAHHDWIHKNPSIGRLTCMDMMKPEERIKLQELARTRR